MALSMTRWHAGAAIVFAGLAVSACQTDQNLAWQGGTASAAVQQPAPAALQGRWEWRVRSVEAICQGLRTTPLEVRGNRVTGGLSHSGDPWLASASGVVDGEGNLRLWAKGAYALITLTGRLADGKGDGKMAVDGEVNCTGDWEARKL